MNKKIKTGFLAIAVIFYGCKKEVIKAPFDGIARVSFTIDGDGFNKQTISFVGVKGMEDNQDVYSSSYDDSGIIISDRPSILMPTNNELTLDAAGKHTGRQDFGQPLKYSGGAPTYVGSHIIIYIGGGNYKIYYSTSIYGPAMGQVNITSYGDTGQAVEGDFNGTYYSNDNKSVVTVTNGHFIVPRLPDRK